MRSFNDFRTEADREVWFELVFGSGCFLVDRLANTYFTSVETEETSLARTPGGWPLRVARFLSPRDVQEEPAR